MNGIHDFVDGGFPLPQGPVWSPALGEFVMGGFPLPMTPVFMPDANGSLPKAPPMPRAAIAHGSAGPASPTLNSLSGISGLSGGMGCGCGPRGFAGMGTLAPTDIGLTSTGDTIIPQASLPTWLQGDSLLPNVPTIYAAGAILAVVVFWYLSPTKKGRR